jgi:hypothetical protein
MGIRHWRLVIALTGIAQVVAQETSTIIPHVDSDGAISWVANIDPITTQGLLAKAGDGSNSTFRGSQALGDWLDAKLAQTGWCRHGWYFLTADSNYIEELSNKGIRVKGKCRTS